MILSRTRLGREVMRLALAALLVLSAVAGARMQGEMAALAHALGSHGAMLCSGASGLPAGTDQDAPASADHCQSCVLPMLGLAAAPVPADISRGQGFAVYAGFEQSLHPVTRTSYGARGPPWAV